MTKAECLDGLRAFRERIHRRGSSTLLQHVTGSNRRDIDEAIRWLEQPEPTAQAPTMTSAEGVVPYERPEVDALSQAVRLAPGEHLLVRRPFRWHLDGHAIPNGYEMFQRDSICREMGLEVVYDFGEHVAVVRVLSPSPAGEGPKSAIDELFESLTPEEILDGLDRIAAHNTAVAAEAQPAGEPMSTDMSPVPSDHPLMRAWTAYQQTEDYANTRKWAAHDEHLDGSLWAAFERGWRAAQPAGEGPGRTLECRVCQLEVHAAWHRFAQCPLNPVALVQRIENEPPSESRDRILGYIQGVTGLTEAWRDDGDTADAQPPADAAPAPVTTEPLMLPRWKCRQCGCLWRDNLDGTVSLFDGEQKSCDSCEHRAPAAACDVEWFPVYLAPPAPADPTLKEVAQLLAGLKDGSHVLIQPSVIEGLLARIERLEQPSAAPAAQGDR